MSTAILPDAVFYADGQFTGMTLDLAQILQRIEQRLDTLGISAEHASSTAKKPDAIRNLRRAVKNNRRTGITTSTLVALAPVLQTTPGWLLEGDHNAPARVPLDEDESPEFIDETDVNRPGTTKSKRHLQPGEIVERNVIAGLGSGADGTVVMIDGQATDEVRDVWRIPPEYIRTELSAREADLDIITVKGDSMQPTILPGDKVMINRTQGLSGDGIYALHDGTGPSVKRLQVMIGTDPIRVRVLSDNPNHENYDVAATDLHVIGRVIWRGTTL